MINERSKEVIQFLLESWDNDGAPLPGDMSYGQVFAMCDEIGVPHPPNIKAFCDEMDTD